MNRFLILSTPRSGTHFLLNNIITHYDDKIFDNDEIIHQDRIGLNCNDDSINQIYTELTKDNYISIIHIYQFAYWGIGIDLFKNFIKNNNINLIILIRKNYLKKFISKKLAEENKCFHTNDDNYLHKNNYIFDYKEYLSYINDETRDVNTLISISFEIKNSKLIFYEDLLKNDGFSFNGEFIKNNNLRFKKTIKNNILDNVLFDNIDDKNKFIDLINF